MVLSGELVAGAEARPGDVMPLVARVTLKPGWHVYAPDPSNAMNIPLDVTFSGPAGVTFSPTPTYPPPKTEKILGEDTKVLDGVVEVRTVARLPDPLPSPLRFKALVAYQACSDTQCLLPVDLELTLDPFAPRIGPTPPPPTPSTSGAPPAPSPSVAPVPPSPSTSTPTSAPPPRDRLKDTLREHGILGLLFLLFLGGLGLNLTPCVFPMIPITVSFFGGQSSGRLSKSLGLAVAYVLGMCVTYSSMGVIAALLGGLLGAALNSPIVVLLISLTFLALALSMFGLFEIQPPAFIADRAGAREGFAGAFLMGLVVGFVAAPCVGPVSAGLLLMVAERGQVFFGFITFFALSLGLGFPYLVLGASAGMISALPRAGMWMESVKRVFGVVLLLVSLYYVRTLVPLPAVTGLAGLVLMGAALGSGLFDPARGEEGSELVFWVSTLRRTGGLAALLAGAYLFVATLHGLGVVDLPAAAGAPAPAGIAWTKDVSLLDKPTDRPVMIDFYSDVWCAACKELDHNTWPDPAVVSESKRFVSVKVDVDDKRIGTLDQLKKRFGVVGIPTVIFLDAKGQEIEVARVAGFVPPDEMVQRMRMAK